MLWLSIVHNVEFNGRDRYCSAFCNFISCKYSLHFSNIASIRLAAWALTKY